MEALSPEQESMLRSAPIRRDINDDTMDLVELKESGLITLSFTNMSGPSYMGKLTPAADVLLATLDAERKRIAERLDNILGQPDIDETPATIIDMLGNVAASLKPDTRGES